MKKKFTTLVGFLLFPLFFSGCTPTTDYSEYISDCRYDIYLYGDDDVTVKVYLSDRESPFVADGICGEVEPFTEVYVQFNQTPTNVSLSCNAFSGEMSYQSAKDCFYLSVGQTPNWQGEVSMELTFDQKQKNCLLTSVVSEGILSCEQALECVKEHAEEKFSLFTKKGGFDGEIFVRLLYDEGCWYYVGLCDKSGTIYAYLADATLGKVIAERTITS
jgi:hypothetical protein